MTTDAKGGVSIPETSSSWYNQRYAALSSNLATINRDITAILVQKGEEGFLNTANAITKKELNLRKADLTNQLVLLLKLAGNRYGVIGTVQRGRGEILHDDSHNTLRMQGSHLDPEQGWFSSALPLNRMRQSGIWSAYDLLLFVQSALGSGHIFEELETPASVMKRTANEMVTIGFQMTKDLEFNKPSQAQYRDYVRQKLFWDRVVPLLHAGQPPQSADYEFDIEADSATIASGDSPFHMTVSGTGFGTYDRSQFWVYPNPQPPFQRQRLNPR